VHVAAYPVKVRVVSGAGDTVVAVLAVMLAAAAGFESAMRAANAAAAVVVVGKRGTATVSAAELRARILPAASRATEEKILFDWSQLDEQVGEWRRQGLRIGFTTAASLRPAASRSHQAPRGSARCPASLERSSLSVALTAVGIQWQVRST
jgi:bifunctional ADP-heptose synthase (sugar kinase/adenylyltransferase)